MTAKLLIRKMGVLGAGTMGSRIAAHAANAGLPVVLLDMASPDGGRNKIVSAAFNALKNSKPAAFFEPGLARLVTIGNFEDDLKLLGDCDWIIEAVAENLHIKRALLQKVSAIRRPDTIVTTNTSGLPVAQIAEGLPEEFRRRWFGTHFFNPPRYMQLLEIVPGPNTDPAVMAALARFASQRLGKTVVFAKDTPNFIANRIGTFAMLNAVRIMQAMDLSIEQIDALTGAAIGWPKTGTFRLADMVGIDVLGHVAKNFFDRVKDERSDVVLPDFIETMLERKWLGDKTGQGFYKKDNEERFALDWKTLEYRPSQRAKFPGVEAAAPAESLAQRVKMLLSGDPAKDKAAAFYWQLLPELWNYAAHRIPEIADSVVEIDTAMRAGFNWEMGPFELWDAAGIAGTVEKMKAAGMPIAPATAKLLDSGNASWYRNATSYFDLASASYRPIELAEGVGSARILKAARGVVRKNAGASLIDLGDGIACIEFHSRMNAIGGDIVSFVTQTLKPAGEWVAHFEGFVISGDSTNFSVGANIMQLLLGIQEQEWDDIDLEIRAFQKMTQAIKFCPRPVVAAPFGMCLGGGCEICLHSAARQPHAELYMGLVETGVGLVPGGGGCKEMTLRAPELEALKKSFETIAMAKVSTSASEARLLGLLSPGDRITMNRQRLLTDAKDLARELADAGYAPPIPRTDIPAPGQNLLSTLKLGVHTMREAQYISDHDVKVANWTAYVLCGGNITSGTPVSEQYLLDLEREAFLSLCGEKKTQERIAFTLKTGKPLRN